MTFCDNAFFINEGKDADAAHLGDDIVIRIDPSSQILPKPSKIGLRNFAIIKIELFIEATWPQLLFSDVLFQLFLGFMGLIRRFFFAAEDSLKK